MFTYVIRNNEGKKMTATNTPVDLHAIDYSVDHDLGENRAEAATQAWLIAAEKAGLKVTELGDYDQIIGWRDDLHAGAVEFDGRVYLLEADGSEVRAVEAGEHVQVSVVEGDQDRDCPAVRGAEFNLPARVIDWAEENGAAADQPERYLLVETSELETQLEGVIAAAKFVLPAELVTRIREIAAEEAARR